MPKEIQPTTRQSYRQAAQVLGRAFVDDPVSVAVYRNFSPDRRVRALTVDFTDELLLCMRKGYPLQVNEDGKVTAAAVIYIWMRWLDEVDKLHPHEPHYYLEYLGVVPEQQGKALGSSILQHIINKADEEHVGCYLENANPRNIPFYQRFGFQIIHEKDIIGIPSWFMWRPPINR